MFAVIKTGGKQYIVTPGQKLKIEKIEAESGSNVVFDEVLLVADDTNVSIGGPVVKGAKVEGTLLTQGRARKITILKYHNKTRHRKKRGHRQHFTEVQINSIRT